jgi:hypothetical protein
VRGKLRRLANVSLCLFLSGCGLAENRRDRREEPQPGPYTPHGKLERDRWGRTYLVPYGLPKDLNLNDPKYQPPTNPNGPALSPSQVGRQVDHPDR